VHAYTLVYQEPATWGLNRIAHQLPGEGPYVFDDSAGAGTCAYVIDTGIYVDHPDFEGRTQYLFPTQVQFAKVVRRDSPRKFFR